MNAKIMQQSICVISISLYFVGLDKKVKLITKPKRHEKNGVKLIDLKN